MSLPFDAQPTGVFSQLASGLKQQWNSWDGSYRVLAQCLRQKILHELFGARSAKTRQVDLVHHVYRLRGLA
jgi:hypothetical protein